MQLEAAIESVGGDYGPSPGILANIILRFTLNLAAAIACWVPLKLFHRKGELAGTAMVAAMALLNFYYALNSVVWHNDDVGSWPKGYGWCDIQLVSWIPLETLNSAAICAVMQNIANQVSLMRASGLTREEKTRKQIIQALIVFPLPVLQVVLYYFVIPMRYNISGIIGCQAVFQANWLFLVFFIVPIPVFAVAAAYYAGLAWWRYRKIDATFRSALYSSSQRGPQAQGAKIKRKLYFMALTIIAPYAPMQLVFLFNNVRLGWPWAMPYSLEDLHVPGWNRIDYAPSMAVPFVSMYINYIAALEVVVFFLYFGSSEEAHEMYRRYILALGLGKPFPRFNEKWHPSTRPTSSVRSLWPRGKSTSSFDSTTNFLYSFTHNSQPRFTKRPRSHIDDGPLFNIHLDDYDLEEARSVTDAVKLSNEGPQLPHRSPWMFRTALAPHFESPKMPTPAFFRRKNEVLTGKQKQSCQEPRHQSLHPVQPESSVHSHHQRGESLESWNPNQDPVLSPRTWAHAFASRIVEDSSIRFSGYESGLVSVREDFSSSAGQFNPRRPVH